MTSPTASQQEPSYNYERGSAIATRAIVDPSSSPTSTMDIAPEYHTPGVFPPNSHAELQHEAETPNMPHLHRRRTNNYEQALTERTVTSGADEPKVVSGLAYRGDKPQGDAPQHPGILGRQQSWKTSDVKRAAMEHMLGAEDLKSSGYTSTGTPAAAK